MKESSESLKNPIAINRYLTIAKEIKPYSKVLDIGCAEAQLLEFLPKCKYIGIDMRKDMIQKLKNNGIEAICLDVSREPLPFKNEFDYVIAGEILEHLIRPYDFLVQVRKVLKVGGILIGTTPNPYALDKILNILFKRERKPSDIWFKKYGHGHVTLFSKEELQTILTQAGFKVIEISSKCLWIPKLRFILWPGNHSFGHYIFFKAMK